MEITRAELRKLYDGLSQAEIKMALGGISNTTLYRLLDKAGIERKRKFVHNPVKLVD
ncbi:hypothetical protein CCP3SC15_2750006 [Gammaproteobacteria bacterium]